jgi:hypothetical protein
MAVVTLELPDTLAQRVKPLSRWLPTILEINSLFLKTSASQTANEIIEFLFSNPSAKSIYEYRASERSQQRVNELMECNSTGEISQAELAELEELVRLEQVVIELKASLNKQEIS